MATKHTEAQRQALAMLGTMAEMQDQHNRHVHSLWREQGYAYYRAVWVECAELLDHFGWKWWKHQRPDLDQVKLEVVDIWHFGLSDLLRTDALGDDVATALRTVADAPQGSDEAEQGERFRLAVEELARQTLVTRAFATDAFVEVLRTLPLPLPELFRLYVGKNVLNNFRQDHGYKTGEYRKVWSGREDNQHLVEILAGLSCDPDDVPAQLYAGLRQRYAGA
ncbi:MAG: dUTP diphosphatase [Pseudomonadales bacterium]